MRNYATASTCLAILISVLSVNLLLSAEQEGYKRVAKIEFIGGKSLNPQVLRNALRLVKEGRSASPDMVEYDIQVNLKGFLEENGFLQCEVSGQLIPLSGKEAKLEIHVSEGPQYRIKKLDLEGEAPFTKDEIYAQFHLNSGEIANLKKIRDALKRVGQMYRDQGYVDWSYIPDRDLDPSQGTVTLIFAFESGIQYRIAYVGFVGCSDQAQEDWLRQLISMRPGDIYKDSKLGESRAAIDKTGTFKQITEEDYAVYPTKDGILGIVFWLTPRK